MGLACRIKLLLGFRLARGCVVRIAIAKAKAQFAEIIRRAEAGEEVELTQYGRSVARIVPPRPEKKIALYGCMKGQFKIADDFDEMPQEFWAALQSPIDPK
jgi:prevent-host-death family protein